MTSTRSLLLVTLMTSWSLSACGGHDTTAATPDAAGAGGAVHTGGAVGTGGAAGAPGGGGGGTVMPGGEGGTALSSGGSTGTQDAGVGGKPSEAGGGSAGHGLAGRRPWNGWGQRRHRWCVYGHVQPSRSARLWCGPHRHRDRRRAIRMADQYKPLGRPGAETEGNDAVLLPNGDVAFTFSAGAEEVKPDNTVVWRFDNPVEPKLKGSPHCRDGHFMVGETHSGGVAYLRELDAMGKVVNSITVNSGTGIGPASAISRDPQDTPGHVPRDLSRRSSRRARSMPRADDP